MVENRKLTVRRKSRPEEKKPPAEPIASVPDVEAPRVASTDEVPPNYFDAAFLDNLAHQLVAPLQCIENHCQNILEDKVPPDKIKMRLKEVVGHARITVALAQRMRFLHELVSQGSAHEQLEILAFDKIVSKWIDGFNNYLPVLKAKNINVEIHHPEMNKLPEVLATPLAVQQVIMNIYDNAAKYADPNSTIDVSAKIKGVFVVLTFRHRGVRILEDEKEKIFQRGYRGTAAARIRAPGTGVGLWVCLRLMEAMQGSMACVPQGLNGETEFRISWRLAK